MSFTITGNRSIRFWPGGPAWPGQPQRAVALAKRMRLFFEVGAAIELTAVEQCILLDVTADEMAQLRIAPSNAMTLGGTKLERRVNYAIPILQRMIAAMAS